MKSTCGSVATRCEGNTISLKCQDAAIIVMKEKYKTRVEGWQMRFILGPALRPTATQQPTVTGAALYQSKRTLLFARPASAVVTSIECFRLLLFTRLDNLLSFHFRLFHSTTPDDTRQTIAPVNTQITSSILGLAYSFFFFFCFIL